MSQALLQGISFFPPLEKDEPQWNPNYDAPVVLPPTDTVTQLAWSPLNSSAFLGTLSTLVKPVSATSTVPSGPNANGDGASSSAATTTTSNPSAATDIQLLAASSWSKQVRLWSVNPGKSSTLLFVLPDEKPVLTCTFLQPHMLLTGGCNNRVARFRVDTTHIDILTQHLAPVHRIVGLDSNVLLSTSWDKTCKFHDIRIASALPQQNSLENKSNMNHMMELSDLPLALDVQNMTCCLATSDRMIRTYDLRNLQQPVHKITSPLQLQIKSLLLLSNLEGFVASSIEGKIAVVRFFASTNNSSTVSATATATRTGVGKANATTAVPLLSSWMMQSQSGQAHTSGSKKTSKSKKDFKQYEQHGGAGGQQGQETQQQDFIFRAHGMKNQIYPINQLLWNPRYQYLMSLGGDGVFAGWNLNPVDTLWESQRLLGPNQVPVPITTGACSPDGSMLAYAIGNDYSKLASSPLSTMPVKIFLHSLDESPPMRIVK